MTNEPRKSCIICTFVGHWGFVIGILSGFDGRYCMLVSAQNGFCLSPGWVVS